MSGDLRFHLDRHKQLDREENATPVHPVTQYVVKIPALGVFAHDNLQWTPDPSRALRFDFMTAATVYALMTLELDCASFEIEPI